MKRILCAAMMLILTGCATKPADPTDIVSTPAATQTPEAAVMPAPEATEAPAVSEPETPETPAAESTSYTAIMLPQRDSYPPVMLAEDDLVSDGYYTMCQNGKWGLMESDGTVLLYDAAQAIPSSGIMLSATAMRTGRHTTTLWLRQTLGNFAAVSMTVCF